MRWNCPHCGTNLAVADEKLGTGWSFSRCYKCAGYALVRRSDVNLIKVDRAPAGENVILPEASENPTAVLSQTAAQNLARYISKEGGTPTVKPQPASSKPLVRTAKPRVRTHPEITIPAAPAQPKAAPVVAAAPKDQNSIPRLFPVGLPEPLPETPVASKTTRWLPVGIGMAAMMVICSGIYLYLQGQALIEKTRTTQSTNAPAAHENESASNDDVIKAPTLAAHEQKQPEIRDEVRAQSMAPTRATNAAR